MHGDDDSKVIDTTEHEPTSSIGGDFAAVTPTLSGDSEEPPSRRRRFLRVTAILLVVACIGLWGFGWLLTDYPAPSLAEPGPQDPPGFWFVETNRRLLLQELDGLGGWLPNDIGPPAGINLFGLHRVDLLDNKPNFQLGVLETVRYTTRVLRDNLSRQRTTDKIDVDAEAAFTLLANDPHRWWLPSPEGRYHEAADALVRYRDRLSDPAEQAAQFYARSDNLIQLLEQYASLLGGVNTRLLAASYSTHKVNVELAGDPEARQSTPTRSRVSDRTSWWHTDDNFYFARGVSFAMLELYRAIEVDFAPVIADKNAGPILKSIIENFETAQFEPWIVTNGTRAGVLANHSNNLRVYLDDARQKTNSLITILSRG